MLPIAIFFLILFAAAMLFAWLMDNPGTVTIDWLGTEITLSMVQSIRGACYHGGVGDDRLGDHRRHHSRTENL